MWDYLDSCGVEFRKTRAELLKQYGSRESGWAKDFNYCEINSKTPFLNNLAHPLAFQYSSQTDLNACPEDFVGYIRDFSDEEKNYSLALKQLQNIFGKGCDVSTSNARSLKWDFGQANITILIFIKEKNSFSESNNRHKNIPGSETECSIRVTPAWRCPVSAEEYGWIEDYIPHEFSKPDYLNGNSVSAVYRPHYNISNLTRDWPDKVPQRDCGFCFTRDKKAVLRITDPSFVDILPLSWVTSVSRQSMLPAKGGGQGSVSLAFKPSGLDGIRQHSFCILKHENPHEFNDIAIKIAEELNLPLNENEFYNA